MEWIKPRHMSAWSVGWQRRIDQDRARENYADTLESTGIQARIRRAERMNLDYICKIYEKPVADMDPGESAILEFFFRYHPDSFKAIDDHLKENQ